MIANQSINCQQLKSSLISGYHNLANNRVYLNEINVFPLPDGDTGTNLYLTFKSGVEHLLTAPGNMTIHDLLQLFVRGLLNGARGNSGVILSQIFRGFLRPITSADQELNNQKLAMCFQAAKKAAYASVMKPVEGTILSVIRAISSDIKKNHDLNDISTTIFFEKIIMTAQKMVIKTQSLLAVAKKNNVVDAGALGFTFFLEGMNSYFQNQVIIEKLSLDKIKKTNFRAIQVKPHFFGYCTEVIIQLHDRYQVKFNLDNVRKKLTIENVDSIVTGLDNDLLKIHGHTLRPGLMINYLQSYGEFREVKVENMTLQYQKMTNQQPHSSSTLTYNHQSGLLLVMPNQQLKTFFQEEFKIKNLIVTQQLSRSQMTTKAKQLMIKNLCVLPGSIKDQKVIEKVNKDSHLFNLIFLPTTNVAEQFLALVYYFPGDQIKKNIVRMNRKLKTARIIRVESGLTPNTYRCYFKEKLINKVLLTKETNLSKLTLTLFKKYIILGKSEIVTLFYNDHPDQTFIRAIKTFLQNEFDVEIVTVDAGNIKTILLICIE